MTKHNKIDYGKLLGFATVRSHLTDKIDFKMTSWARSSALRWDSQKLPRPVESLDYAKLLGFQTVREELTRGA